MTMMVTVEWVIIWIDLAVTSRRKFSTSLELSVIEKAYYIIILSVFCTVTQF